MRLTSSLSLKNEDVEKQLLLSTSVPIKIGNDFVTKKDAHKNHHRIRYTFGLRAIKSNTTAIESTSDHNDQIKPQIQDQQQQQQYEEQPKSKLVDNLSKTNSKLVKQTTIDYYV